MVLIELEGIGEKGMPNKTIYFSDQEYGFLLAVAAKEYPSSEGEVTLKDERKKKDVDPLSKLIQKAALKTAKELALKYKIKIPRILKGESKA